MCPCPISYGMDELIIAGNKYISSKRAAKLTGYTTDYLGQLCRADKIHCKLLGRNWYIGEEAVIEQKKDFKKEQIFGTGQLGNLDNLVYYDYDNRPLNPELNSIVKNKQSVDRNTASSDISTGDEQSIKISRSPVRSAPKVSHNVQRVATEDLRHRVAQSQQVERSLMKIPLMLGTAIVLLLIVVSVVMLEQTIYYVSNTESGNASIATGIQLANTHNTLLGARELVKYFMNK